MKIQMSHLRANRAELFHLALSGLAPTILITLWNHFSEFYVVYDDGEYWHQSFTVYRDLLAGKINWWNAYTFAVGRPSIHYLYGLFSIFAFGPDVTKCTQVVMTTFYALLGVGSFLFVNRLTKSSAWALISSSWVTLQANYYFLAQIFLSELPFLVWFVWSAYFFQRSSFFEHRKWSIAAGIAAGLSICSRPIEGQILYLLVGAITTIYIFSRNLIRPTALILPVVALFAAGSIIYRNFEIRSGPVAPEIYFAILFCLLPVAWGVFSNNRTGNFLASIGIIISIYIAWLLPRTLIVYYWIRAAAYTDKMSLSEMLSASGLIGAFKHAYTVCNVMAGPHLLLLSTLLVLLYFYRGRFREAYWILSAILVVVLAALSGGFVKNPSTKEAIDRYYSSEILVLYLAAGIGIWRLGKTGLRSALAGLVILFSLANMFMAIDPIYPKSHIVKPSDNPHPWLYLSLVRTALRTENHFAISGVNQLKALLPDPYKESDIYLAPGTDIPHRFFALRGLELGHGWRLHPRYEIDHMRASRLEESLSKFYDFVLLGPTEYPGFQGDLKKKVRAQGGKLLGTIELTLSEHNVHLDLYKIK